MANATTDHPYETAAVVHRKGLNPASEIHLVSLPEEPFRYRLVTASFRGLTAGRDQEQLRGIVISKLDGSAEQIGTKNGADIVVLDDVAIIREVHSEAGYSATAQGVAKCYHFNDKEVCGISNPDPRKSYPDRVPELVIDYEVGKTRFADEQIKVQREMFKLVGTEENGGIIVLPGNIDLSLSTIDLQQMLSLGNNYKDKKLDDLRADYGPILRTLVKRAAARYNAQEALVTTRKIEESSPDKGKLEAIVTFCFDMDRIISVA